ncbi:unnamed protein product [Calypogeia fissa]
MGPVDGQTTILFGRALTSLRNLHVNSGVGYHFFTPALRRFLPKKYIGGPTKLSILRNVVSTDPLRLQLPAPRSRQFDYSTSAVPSLQRGSGGSQGRRAFADYTFYKGKGAMSMKPGKPVFKTLDTGDLKLEKEGCMYLEFAPALGPRQYDWSRRQIIALSVLELGTLVGLSMGETCEFFHDPLMGKSDAGKIRKVLKVEPMSDQTGFFFNLYVSNKLEALEARISIALTRAEYSVLRSSANYMIPYLMGWHMVVDPSKLDEFISEGTDSSPLSVNEWQK